MDRLSSMTAFAKAVELGSFSAAGEALGMSSQLVGKQVQALEQQLGVRLLNRTTRRQHLTDIGATFYERVKIILAEVEAAEDLAAETRATPRGRLRISTPVSFGIHALSPRLPEYLRAYPEVSIDLAVANRYVDVIEEGFDAVFRVGELSDSSLIARPLAPYRLVLCAAPAYLSAHAPIRHPRDLAQHECLGFSHTELRANWTFDGPDGRVSVPVSGRLMSDSGESLCSVAVAAMGLLLQPRELVQDELDAGRLIEVLPEYQIPTRPMHIVYAPDRRITPKLRSFIDFALTTFGSPTRS